MPLLIGKSKRFEALEIEDLNQERARLIFVFNSQNGVSWALLFAFLVRIAWVGAAAAA